MCRRALRNGGRGLRLMKICGGRVCFVDASRARQSQCRTPVVRPRLLQSKLRRLPGLWSVLRHGLMNVLGAWRDLRVVEKSVRGVSNKSRVARGVRARGQGLKPDPSHGFLIRRVLIRRVLIRRVLIRPVLIRNQAPIPLPLTRAPNRARNHHVRIDLVT